MDKINRLVYGILLLLALYSSTTYAALESREPFGATQYTLEFSKWNETKNYSGGRDNMSSSTYSSGVTVEILNIVTDSNDSSRWLITYKASGYISAYCRSVDSSYGASARTSINGSTIQGNVSTSSGSDSYRESVSYDGSATTISVSKGENPMRIYVKVRTYSRTYLISTTREQTKIINMNNSPHLSAQIDRNYMNGKDSQSITVSGQGWDIEQDSIVITAELDGITRTKIIDNPKATMGQENDYTFTFLLSEYPNDIIKTLKVTVRDYYEDTSYTSFTIYIDRIDPQVTTQNDVKIKGGEYVSVTPTEQSDIYLLRNDRPYLLYSDVLSAVNEDKGIAIGNCSTKTNLSVPTTLLEGSYRLFSVDNGKNVSQPSENIVMVDNSVPEKVNIFIEGNTIRLVYDEVLKPSIPSKDDFILPRENIISSSVCILADEDNVDYEFIFDDYEGDEKYAERFVFSAFDNSMFTNTNGIPDIIGKTASTKSSFHEVGRYTLEYQAQDTPVPGNENRFNNYRKWGNKNLIQLLVHRRPLANLTINASLSNDKWIINGVNGTGYDLDHMDMANKGIQDDMYEWKKMNDSQYTPGIIPNTVAAVEGGKDVEYVVKYKVQDIEGVWSEPVIFIISADPPIEIEASLKSEDSKFSISSIPASENLVAYDVKTIFNKLHYLDMALYNSSNSIVIDLTRRQSSNTSYVSQNGNKFYWVDKVINIPATLADGTYKFIVKATDASNSLKTKEKEFSVTVDTPINLQSSMTDLDGGSEAIIPATTSIYANEVNVILFYGTPYATSLDMSIASNNGTTKYWTAKKGIAETIPEGYYKARFTARTPNGNVEYLTKDFYLNQLKIVDMTLWGEWNYWRGQVNLFGKQLVNMPHRFLSYEKVHIETEIKGNPDQVYVRFSPELEAMIFTNQYGHTYHYSDHIGYTVNFPLTMTSSDGENYKAEYILPLAKSTMNDEDTRLGGQYWVEVTATKGSTTKTMRIDDIDITGNTLDKIYIQPE
ncbi:hypothetical protein HZI73_26275 (plasmid) [Vallitalea pronyensis]|uniref:Uncharacterized protein n=1 Tax=Vallitalea pronyensis TaxID=1348613 RepID=A0A8J8MQC8_9FIRM|nr:hypothetical protein [Vallitalea pronyensis]QUI25922.1 hypothetical protein HZI73_26275 [Vallitalea pronyensis]